MLPCWILIAQARQVLGVDLGQFATATDSHPRRLARYERRPGPVVVSLAVLEFAALGAAAGRVLSGESADLLTAYVWDSPVRLWRATRNTRAHVPNPIDHGLRLVIDVLPIVVQIDQAAPPNEDTIAARQLIRQLKELLDRDEAAGFPVLGRPVGEEL